MFKVKFADIGEGLTEGKVTEVYVKTGDMVKEGDSLFGVETDKVTSDIPSPVSGKISKMLIKNDQEIKVGDVVIEIDNGSSASDAKVEKKQVQKEEKEDNASVVGSTPVSNEMIERKVVTSSSSLNTNIRATPLARKMAADKGIDLSSILGTGPNGRILAADLTSGDKIRPNISSARMTNAPDKLSWTSKPMSGVRKATVKAMTYSHNFNAAFSGMKDIDITPTYETRTQLKDYSVKNNVKLTYMAFIVSAVAKSLEEMPNINSRIDLENNAILEVKNINIGIAIDTKDGLFVPVIKNANYMSIFEIADKITELADKARNKKISMSDMSDGTFTISNFGSVGLDYATPIINSPESAILGIGTMKKVPTYINDQIQARYIMPFSITADHRIIDGADAGRFLIRVENYLNNPSLLLI